MSVREYRLQMTASTLRKIDEEETLHEAAWLNREIEATRASGRHREYVYKRFKDFYDKENEIQKVMGSKGEEPKGVLARLIAYHKQKDKQEECGNG